MAAIARAQRCWAELGYYKAEVDGKRGRATRSAFSQFKREHGLASQSDILAEPVQQKIAELCKTQTDDAPLDAANDPLAPQQEAGTAAPQTPSGNEATLASPETGAGEADSPAMTSPMLRTRKAAEQQAAGRSPRSRLSRRRPPRRAPARPWSRRRRSEPASGACVMPPTGLPQAQIDAMQAAGAVAWCRTCVPISGQLALNDVRRIERAGNVELCPIPPRQLAKYGEGVTDGLRSYLRVRELYRALPPMAEDPGRYAVIIGNRSYDRLPRSVTSYNDADAVYAFLTERLGFRPDNIIDLRDAKKADFERVFGAEPGFDGELARRVEGKPDAKIVVYYSGHGATDEAQTETYLLPVDAEPYREASGGYKLATLYANLAKLKANSVLVLLETEYGPRSRRLRAAPQSARDREERLAAGFAAGRSRSLPPPIAGSAVSPTSPTISASSPAT